MPRHRVTYLEVADERHRPTAPARLVDLDPRTGAPLRWSDRPARRERPACPAWLAQLALVAIVLCGAVWAETTTSPDERHSAERARERHRPALAAPSVDRGSAPAD